MKKAIVTLCAIIAFSTTLMAGGRVDSVRYLTTKAGQNWFISAQGTANWWKGSLMTPANFKDYNTINPQVGFGGSFAVGKWINHKIAIRVAYDVNRDHSYIYGRHLGNGGKNYQFLYDGTKCVDEGADIWTTSFIYHNLHGGVMVSPIDFFQGYYNPNRVYTPIIYVGMGCAAVGPNVFILQTLINNNKNNNQKQGINFELSFDASLMNNFRINDYLDINLELKYSFQRWNIDSWENEYQGMYYNDGTQAHLNHNEEYDPDENGNMPTSIRPKRLDHNFAVGLGLTYYIGGRIYELPYNYENEMKEMRDHIQELENELTAAPIPVPVPTAADTVYINVNKFEAISYPFSIFFNLDSYELMSKRDLVNLQEIAKVAKEQGYKLRLRGSCDSATATPEYNQRLSENRCRKIQDELIKMGFPENDIIMEPVGGVNELNPTEFDRRVLIDVIKYNDKQ